MAKVEAAMNFYSQTLIISAIFVTITTKQLKVSDQVSIDVVVYRRPAIGLRFKQTLIFVKFTVCIQGKYQSKA